MGGLNSKNGARVVYQRPWLRKTVPASRYLDEVSGS
jgi:hypothetical protein